MADLVRAENFSLQAHAELLAGRHHLDREPRFAHRRTAAEEHIGARQLVISGGGKIKEHRGNCGCREYRPDR